MHYFKTGILPIDYGHLYNNLQRLREKSDYNCFFDVSEQDIVDGISIAAEFIKAIEQLISERNKWNRCQSQRFIAFFLQIHLVIYSPQKPWVNSIDEMS